MKKTGKIINCLFCNKEKYYSGWQLRRINAGKFCSYNCYWESLKGKPSWNKGLHPEYMQGINNHQWKEKPAYITLHAWIYRHKGKANSYPCEKCGTRKVAREWANISYLYLRDITDYEVLCIPCHRKKDSNQNRGKIKLVFS